MEYVKLKNILKKEGIIMNEYVKKEMKKKGLEYSDDIYMRYDPYEMYIYYTGRDKFIEL